MTKSFTRFTTRLFLVAIVMSLCAAALSAAGSFTVTPPVLTFGVNTVGSSSMPMVVTLKNGTASTVTISSIVLGAPNPNDFTISAKTCTTSLAASASCTVTILFKPTQNDIREANLNITDSAAGSPQVVNMTGFGQAPTQSLIFTPDVITFPITNVGTSSNTVQIQVSNFSNTGVTFSGVTLIGNNSTDFAIANNSCTSLNAGVNSCYVTLQFTPTAPGARQASLEFNANVPGSPYVVLLLGTGQALTQAINIAAQTGGGASMSFGVQEIGQSSGEQYFQIQNIGTGPVTMLGYVLGGTNSNEFSIASNGCPSLGSPLAAGSPCYIYLTFSPQATGAQSATLTVNDTATGSPQVASVFGIGQNVADTAVFSKSTIDLGAVTLNVVSGQSGVSLLNTGNINITVTSVLIGGTNASDFSISSNGCTTVSSASSCTVYVTFTPKATGLRKATLTFTDSAIGSPQVINLEGTGVAVTQTLALQYLDYDFGVYTVGVPSSIQYFYIENTGDSAVPFTSEALTGTNASDFTIYQNGCPSAGTPLGAGSQCYVAVMFTPSAAGLRQASLQFTDMATGSPQSISLVGEGLAPTQTLTFSSPTLIFTPVQVFNSGGQQNVTITNAGDQTVTFSGASIGGANASAFSVASNGCGSLSPGNNCSVAVSYSPNATGILSAALQLTDTATGSPQSIPLASDGESAGGGLSLSTELMNFGGVNQGGSGIPIQVTVSNPTGSTISFTQNIVGTNASDYNVTNNTCTGSLASGTNCAVTVGFTPTAVGLRLAALEFTAAGISQDVLLAGSSSSTSTIVALQSTYDFGEVTVGNSSSVHNITLQNTGTETVTFTGTTIAGSAAADYTVASNTCTVLTAGQTCTLAMVFSPGAASVRPAILDVNDSASGSPQAVALSGIGQAAGAGLTAPAAIDFSSSNVGAPVTLPINLFNNGTSQVTISGLAISGTNASSFGVNQSYNCLTINPFNNCTIYVTFNPTAAGILSATLTISDNATGSPQIVALSGLGVTSTASLSAPGAVAFNATVVGTSTSAQQVQLQNTGTATVNITSTSITGTNAGDFSLSQSCTQISAGYPCYLYVVFTPSSTGVRVANLVVTSNAVGSPLTIPLTGIGQVAIATISLPASVTFPTTTQNMVSTVNFTMYNTGNVPITFSSVTVSGLLAADFRVGYWCPTLSPGQGCPIYVSFTNVPGGAGVATPNLVFTDNAAGSPQKVLLTGVIQGATETVGLSSTALTFAGQSVGTISNAQSLTVYNNGNGPITVRSVQISGANASDFSVTYDTCVGTTLTGGTLSQCYLNVVFTPMATGSRSATLTITDTGVGATQTVALSGTGM